VGIAAFTVICRTSSAAAGNQDSPDALAVAPTPPAPKRPVVPPFDIQDIPGAMRQLGMPMSARLMERWFSGQLNYSKNDADEKAETDQNGPPYPPNMIDTTSITMAWVL
jgi:hypothetical protein